jgi:hypothetical protein
MHVVFVVGLVHMMFMWIVFVVLVMLMGFVERFGFGELGLSRTVARFHSVTQRFAGQHFRPYRNGNRRGHSVRLGLPMTVLVIFKIFENVADVQEGVAVKPDVHERGLHARKHPRNSAFVDTANQRELFFALDVNLD